MIRLIKRYGSRKLYDTEESRYVSLEEIGDWVRGGQEVKVVDNATSDDVTAQTLTLVILEEGRKGSSILNSELLHQLIRRGEELVNTGVETLQTGVDRALQASLDRIPPLRRVREETLRLRERLDALEASLAEIEADLPAGERPVAIGEPAIQPAIALHESVHHAGGTGHGSTPTASAVATGQKAGKRKGVQP